MTDKEIKIKITANDSASANVSKVRDEFDKLAKSAGSKNLKQGIQSISDQLARTKQQFLGFFFGLPALGQVVKGFRLAETFKEVNAGLKNAAESSDEFNQSQRETTSIALKTGQSLESIAGLYGKLRVNAGLAAEDSAKLTSIIAKATQLDGGGAGTEAAIFQLQQGLAAGALRGAELNSVLEQTPSLAKAIADGLGVNIGQLRKIAEQGGLTAEVVRDALFSMEGDINSKFSKLPLTTARVFQNIRTQAILTLGKLDEQLGITEGFSNILQGVADNIQSAIALVSGGLVTLITIFIASSKGAFSLSAGAAAAVVGLKLLLSPIGLVAIALGGLTTFFIANIDKTVEFGNKTTTVGNIVAAAWRTIRNAVSEALDATAKFVGVTGQDISSTLIGLTSVAKGMFAALIDFVNQFVTAVFTGFRFLARSAYRVSASIEQQFKNVFSNLSELFSDFSFGKAVSTITNSFSDARREAVNLKDSLIEAYEIEAKFAEGGGVLGALKRGITDQLDKIKSVQDEFKKRTAVGSSPDGGGSGSGSAAARNAALRAEQELAKARLDFENTLFQQAKRLADDQAQRDIQSTKQLFELKAITADEYYVRLNQLQTDLANREIAELNRQKAIRQSIVDDPKSSEANRLKALADITELSASAAIIERGLQDSRSTLMNEIAALEATRLKSQQDFIAELKQEAFLSGLSNEERETALLLMEAQKRGIQDINGLLQIQSQIQANNQAKQRAEEILRQQNQIFESVQRGVQQSFSDGIYNAVKGGDMDSILKNFSDTMLRVMSNNLAGGLTDTLFNVFGRKGAGGESGPAGIFSGMFDGLSKGLSGFLGKLKSGLSSFFSAIGGLFSGGGGGGIFGSLLGAFSGGKKFAEGGYTGPGSKYQPAGVVHAGEYVFSAAAVRRLGLAALDNLHRLSKGAPVSIKPRVGYAEGGLVNTPPSIRSQNAASNITLSLHPDAINMTLRDWLEGELARIAVGGR